jgi:hypothetical protein
LPVLEKGNQSDWQTERYLYHHVARWPSGLAASHKYAMAGVRQGHYLLLRSEPCGDPAPACEAYQSQCTTLRSVNKGLTTTTYARGTAQTHWGTTTQGQWALFDVREDPGCRNDLSGQEAKRVAMMSQAYDQWWDRTFPIMIAKGGDAGDPLVSRRASKKARDWKGPTSDKATQSK